MDVDILEFLVPVENNKTLFVWDIQPGHAEARIYGELHHAFSSFGPLYLVKVRPNAPLGPAGFYALIKFYSASHASEAQQQMDGRSLFQDAPLKVRLSSKQTPHFLSDRQPLSHARCRELANHCLGFNGWTSDIITLKELPNDEEEEEEGGVTRKLKVGCLLQLSFPRHGRTTRGAAVVEESFTFTCPDEVLQKRCKLHKLARERALVHAFASVLLVLLGEKVMVEVRPTSNELSPDEAATHVQVNELPYDEGESDGELWDLTLS